MSYLFSNILSGKWQYHLNIDLLGDMGAWVHLVWEMPLNLKTKGEDNAARRKK
jgi:hypothetical protein